MARRRGIDLERIRASLDAMCPRCGRSISPAEIVRVDSDQVKCPRCGEVFKPGPENPIATS